MSYELLDSKKILPAIEPKNHPRLLEIFEAIDSTNNYLLEGAKAFAQSGWVVFAEQQTHGRGRRGKTWVSPPNTNIYFSVLWRFTQLQNVSGLSVAIAVMIARALKKYGISGIQLKWPNDILFSGKKLAGILIESPHKNSAVIGIGLNLVSPKEEFQAIGLNDIFLQSVARNHLAGLLINEMFSHLPIFETQGLSAFIDDWQSQDALIGKKITIHMPKKTLYGTMRGINTEGELVLETEEGNLENICYGEASVRTSAQHDQVVTA